MARKPAPPGADRRQLILEAALDVFAERGFEGATTKEIAARAGVTHGLIYFYFTSKEELFQAAFDHTLRGALDELSIPGADEPGDEPGDEPAVVIERSVARLLEILSSPRAASLARIMMRMAATGDRGAGPLGECKLSMTRAIGSFANAFVAYLDAQIASGRLRPVNARAVVTLLIGGVIATFRSGALCPLGEEAERTRNAREWAHALSDVVLRGLEPHPGLAETGPAAAVTAPADP